MVGGVQVIEHANSAAHHILSYCELYRVFSDLRAISHKMAHMSGSKISVSQKARADKIMILVQQQIPSLVKRSFPDISTETMRMHLSSFFNRKSVPRKDLLKDITENRNLLDSILRASLEVD